MSLTIPGSVWMKHLSNGFFLTMACFMLIIVGLFCANSNEIWLLPKSRYLLCAMPVLSFIVGASFSFSPASSKTWIVLKGVLISMMLLAVLFVNLEFFVWEAAFSVKNVLDLLMPNVFFVASGMVLGGAWALNASVREKVEEGRVKSLRVKTTQKDWVEAFEENLKQVDPSLVAQREDIHEEAWQWSFPQHHLILVLEKLFDAEEDEEEEWVLSITEYYSWSLGSKKRKEALTLDQVTERLYQSFQSNHVLFSSVDVLT